MAQTWEEDKAIVQMWISRGTYEDTHKIYDALHAESHDIESELGLQDDVEATIHWAPEEGIGTLAYGCRETE